MRSFRHRHPLALLAVGGLLACLLVGGPAVAEDDEKAAIAKLESVFPDGRTPDKIAALREARETNTPAMSKAIAKVALHGNKDGSVQIEAMRSLGRMKNDESVKALHHTYKAHQSLQKDENWFVTLLTEVGRLGDPSSVKLLKDHPFKHGTKNTGRARIYGLGNIRTKDAVAALIWGIKLEGPQARGVFGAKQDVLLPDFRTALTVLTGEDQGNSRTLWANWWREQGKAFEIEPDMPVIPAKLETYWEDFWDEPYPVEQPVHGFPTFEWVMEPTKEQVKNAVDELNAAKKSKSAARQLAAIYSNMLIVDPKVIKAIRKTAKNSGRSVIEAAIDALGWIPHKTALKELQGVYKRHRDLYKFENYYSRMLKAIGRHSDESSLKILMDKPLKGLTMASGRARILGTARIRSKKAVESLMHAMQLGGGDGRRPLQMTQGGQPFMGALRLALVVLTGVDKGKNKTAWQTWWRENKRTFKISEERPDLDESMREAWEEYWEEPYKSR